jgi:hypothetical protein
MIKKCVFCVEKPTLKTKEHIIPKWLIKLTGDPNRNMSLGFIPNFQNLDYQIAFDQFVVPACKNCNEKFSELENQTKLIILNLLKGEKLSFFDLNTLFSWLDKIRIGLWVSYIYLGKNYFGINPHFYIKNRIDQKDRLTIIFRTNFMGKRLNFSGVHTPAFQYLPCCFGLFINNYIFINISSDFLFSSRFGLPYPKESFFTPDGQLLVKLSNGRKKIKFPLFNSPFKNYGTQIFQPMIKDGMKQNNEIYNNDYIKKLCFDFENGIGKIFLNNIQELITYPLEKSELWLPKNIWDYEKIIPMINYNILEIQNKLTIESQASFKYVDDEKRKTILHNLELAIDINNYFKHELKKA